jgi:hypothetical protein
MNFSNLNTTVLRQVLKLSEQKETLLKEIEKIEHEIFSYLQGGKNIISSTAKSEHTTKTRGSSKKRSRGSLKTSILNALRESGAEGIKITALAEKINAKNASVRVWFSNVGKKLTEIEKIAPGHFRIRQ